MKGALYLSIKPKKQFVLKNSVKIMSKWWSSRKNLCKALLCKDVSHVGVANSAIRLVSINFWSRLPGNMLRSKMLTIGLSVSKTSFPFFISPVDKWSFNWPSFGFQIKLLSNDNQVFFIFYAFNRTVSIYRQHQRLTFSYLENKCYLNTWRKAYFHS